MAYRFTDSAPYRFQTGGLFLGVDQDGQPVGINTERHAITVGGSRSGKGAAMIVPNARRWPANLLVIDPKGENAALTWEAREAMGQRVHVLDPFKVADVPDRLRAAFNPLAAIDPASPTAREDLQVIADGLVKVHDPRHMEWIEGARDILAGIMAYVIADAPPQFRTFAKVRETLLQDDAGLHADAQRMLQIGGGLARSAGAALVTALTSEKSMERDFLGGARRASKWLDSEPIAAVLDRSTFDLSEIKTGAASVYLVLPPQYISTYAPFLRLFVRCAINAMAGGGSGRGKRCLFLLDEFFALGKIEEVATAAGLMPSYGVHLWPFVQDLGQLIELYGKMGAETFFANADAATFFGNGDAVTLDYVSARIGTLTPNEVAPDVPVLGSPLLFNTPEAQQASQRFYQNDRAIYDHAMRQAGRPRLTADEVRELIAKKDGDAVARSMIVFAKGRDVLNLRLRPYFVTDRPAAAVAPLMNHHAPVRPAGPILPGAFSGVPRKLIAGAVSVTAMYLVFLGGDALLGMLLPHPPKVTGWTVQIVSGLATLFSGIALAGWYGFVLADEFLSDYLA